MEASLCYQSAQDFLKDVTAQSFAKDGAQEVSLYDKALAKDKQKLLYLLTFLAKNEVQVFLILEVALESIDQEVLRACTLIDCSLEIPIPCDVSKKKVESVAQRLNRAELVFGFTMDFGSVNDNGKAFKDRLDFLLSLYPNHIYFEPLLRGKLPKSTGTFSSKDIEHASHIAFACNTFYTCGRAVAWFSVVVKPLKIAPHAFFADFSEWQQCNNCSKETGFLPEETAQSELEKMQLLFLRYKYEEKHKEELFLAASDLIRIHGAFSRIAADEEDECIIETSYMPDDILSPAIFSLERFTDTFTMQPCKVRIFRGNEYPEYKIINELV